MASNSDLVKSLARRDGEGRVNKTSCDAVILERGQAGGGGRFPVLQV